MEYKCPTCGCCCRYDKHDAAKYSTLHPMKTENLCLEGSASLQCSSLSLSDTLTISTLTTDAANGRTNELSEACLAADAIQGCTLDVMYNKLKMETLPDGFVCNKMSDKILLYKLDVSGGLIAVEYGIIITNNFQIICSSYNELLPDNFYVDLLSQGKQMANISQLLELVTRLNCSGQELSDMKTEPGCSYSDQICDTELLSTDCEVKLEPEEWNTESETLIRSLGKEYLQERRKGELHFKYGNNSLPCDSQVDTLPESVLQISNVKAYSEVLVEARRPVSDQINDQWYYCSLCHESFEDEMLLSQHNQQSHNKKKFDCNQCEYSANYSQNLKSHISAVHLEKKPHECPECGNCFTRKDHLSTHIRSVHNLEKPYSCNACDFRCSVKSNLTQHQRTVHDGVKCYPCAHCDYRSSTRSSLIEHSRVMHGIEKYCSTSDSSNTLSHPFIGHKTFPCTQCDSNFSRKTELQRHMKHAHVKEKLYLCSVCSKSFSRLAHAKVHEETIHRGCRPHHCEKCSRSFSVKSNLTAHIKAVHK